MGELERMGDSLRPGAIAELLDRRVYRTCAVFGGWGPINVKCMFQNTWQGGNVTNQGGKCPGSPGQGGRGQSLHGRIELRLKGVVMRVGQISIGH